MISVQVDVTQVAEIKDRLDRLGEKLFMFDQAMADIGKGLDTYYSTIGFDSQGGVFDDVWAALSSSYAAWKAKKLGTPILVADSNPHMRDSFTFDSNATSVRVYNNSDHFDFIQLGTSRMPARPMIAVNDDVRGLINDIINQDINDKIASV